MQYQKKAFGHHLDNLVKSYHKFKEHKMILSIIRENKTLRLQIHKRKTGIDKYTLVKYT